MNLNEYRLMQKRNKFHAKSTSYNGRIYHSKKEASYAMELDWMKKAGMIKDWIPQFKLSLDVNEQYVTNYYIDFKVIMNNDEIEMHEVKGFAVELGMLKFRLAKAIYQQYKFVLIK